MIFEMLDTGAGNARTARELAQVLQVDQRRVTALVEVERREGKPICATSSNRNPGYYVADNRAEMERYCNRLQRRAGEINKTRAACLETLEGLP